MYLRGNRCRQELGTGAHAAMIDQRAFKIPKFYIVCWSTDDIKSLYQVIKTLIWSFLAGITVKQKSYTLLNTCPKIFQKLLWQERGRHMQCYQCNVQKQLKMESIWQDRYLIHPPPVFLQLACCYWLLKLLLMSFLGICCPMNNILCHGSQ